jgi:hypothetical protein
LFKFSFFHLFTFFPVLVPQKSISRLFSALGTLITYSPNFSIRENECLEGRIEIDITGGSDTTRATQARVMRFASFHLLTDIKTAGETIGVIILSICILIGTRLYQFITKVMEQKV